MAAAWQSAPIVDELEQRPQQGSQPAWMSAPAVDEAPTDEEAPRGLQMPEPEVAGAEPAEAPTSSRQPRGLLGVPAGSFTEDVQRASSKPQAPAETYPGWSDVVASDAFQQGDTRARHDLRQQYFRENIAPGLEGDERRQAEREFYSSPEADIRARLEGSEWGRDRPSAVDYAKATPAMVGEGAVGSFGAAIEGAGLIGEQASMVEADRQVDDAIRRLETTEANMEEALAGTNDRFRDRVASNYEAMLEKRQAELHEALTDWAEREPSKVAQWLRDRGMDLREVAQEIGPGEEFDGVYRDVAGGVGSMLSYMAPGMLAARLTSGASAGTQMAAGLLTSSAMAGPSGVTEQYQRAIAGGLPEEEAIETSMKGLPAGVIQVAPLASIIKPLPAELQGRALGQLYGILRTAGSEFVVENAGAIMQNLVEQSYNPERGTWDDTPYQGMVAGGSAAIIQALTLGLTRGRGGMGGTTGRTGRTSEGEPGLQLPEAGNPEITPEATQAAEQVAAEIEAAAQETDTDPTPAQAEAGNYRKGKVRVNGFEIAIENPRGSTRRGTAPDGTEWESQMAHHYGDIKGTRAADGDNLDVFIGENPAAESVFVIDQVNEDGSFDEHKVMMGFDSQEQAQQGYLANYEDGWQGLGAITEMPAEEFRTWVEEGDTTQPLALERAEGEADAEASDPLSQLIAADPAGLGAQDAQARQQILSGDGYSLLRAQAEAAGNVDAVAAVDRMQALDNQAAETEGSEATRLRNEAASAYAAARAALEGQPPTGLQMPEAQAAETVAPEAPAAPQQDVAAAPQAEPAADLLGDAIPSSPLEADAEPGALTPVRVPVERIRVDPEAYQFRTEVNERGVDDRMEGIRRWDDLRAGELVLHERTDGELYVADGHHRLDLARRLEQPGVNAFVLREADGYSVEDARRLAAERNIAGGSSTAIDAAKVFRNTEGDPAQVIEERDLPRRSQVVRDGADIARLQGEAFGAVLNAVVSEKDGAAIGRAFDDAGQQMAAIDVFRQVQPQNDNQRALLVNEIRQAGFADGQSDQMGMFGDDPMQSLIGERVRVMDRLRQELSRDRRLFATLNNNAQTAEAAGNRIATEANEVLSDTAAQAIALLERATTTPEINQQINDAARRVSEGEAVAPVVRELKEALLRGPESEAAQQPVAPDPGRGPAEGRGQVERGDRRAPASDAARAEDAGEQRLAGAEAAAQGVTLKADGTPFQTERAVQLSKRFRDTPGAVAVEVDGGWGFTVQDVAQESPGPAETAQAAAQPDVDAADTSAQRVEETAIDRQVEIQPLTAGRSRLNTDITERNPQLAEQIREEIEIFTGEDATDRQVNVEARNAERGRPAEWMQDETVEAILDDAGLSRTEEQSSPAAATEAPAPAPLNLADPQTGQPIEGTGYRVDGIDPRTLYAGAQVPVMGSGTYVALTPEDARVFADNESAAVREAQVRMDNPLVIRGDNQWRALTRDAGWETPNPSMRSAEQTEQMVSDLHALVRERGHDGIAVLWNDNTVYDMDETTGQPIKLLRDVFSKPQAVQFDQADPLALETQTEESLAAREQETQAAEQAEAESRRQEAQRAQADRDVGDFLLTGSDSAADQAMARGQDSLFRLEPPADVAARRDAIAEAIGQHPELAGVQPVAQVGELPADVQITMLVQGIDPRSVRGVFVGGELYVVAENVTDTADGVRVAVHEAVGHHGVRQVLGDRLASVMNRLYLSFPRDHEVFQQVRERYPHLDTSTPEGRQEFAEELVAHLAETNPQVNAWQRFVAAVRDLLRQTFGEVAWTENDVRALIQRSRETLAEQALADGTAVAEEGDTRFSLSEAPGEPRSLEGAATREEVESRLMQGMTQQERAELFTDAEWAQIVYAAMAETAQPAEAPQISELQQQLQDEHPGLKLFTTQRGDVATIQRIELPAAQREQGTGTQIMEQITGWADENGITLALTPTADFGGTVGRLRDFYQRYGFADNTGRARDHAISETMVRRPAGGEDVLFSLGGDGPGSTAWQRAEAKGLDMSQEGRMRRAREMGYIASIDEAITAEMNDAGEITYRERAEGAGGAVQGDRGNRDAGLGVRGDLRNAGGGDAAGSPGGVPQTFYHGTAEDIDAFQIGHWSQKDAGWLGQGVYVTSNPDLATSYANTKTGMADPNVMPLFIKPSSLLRVPLAKKQSMMRATPEQSRQLTERLRAIGFDGVITTLQDRDATQEIALFNTEDIRSTQAAFDPDGADSSDLLFSLGDQADRPTATEVQESLRGIGGMGQPVVVESADGLALGVALEATVSGVNPQEAVAFYHGDQLYVVAGNAQNAGEAVRATVATVTGRQGLRQTIGNRADPILRDVLASAQRHVAGRDVIRAVTAEFDHISMDHQADQMTLATEVLARLSERSDPPAFVGEASQRLDTLLQELYPEAGFATGDGAGLARTSHHHLAQQQRDFGKKRAPYALPFVFTAQDGPGHGSLLEFAPQVVDADGNIVSDARVDTAFQAGRKLGLGFFESATDRLRRSGSPMLVELANRTDAYFDQAEARLGIINGMLRDPLRRLKSLNPLQQRRNMRDFEAYMRHRDNGRQAQADEVAASNPAVAELAEAVDAMFDRVGTINQTVKTPQGTGMRVFDSKIGAYRKVGKINKGQFWPRAMRPEVQRVMRDPTSNPALWHELLDALIDEGHAETRKQAAEYLRGEKGYFSSDIANDYFAGIEKARGEKLPEIFYDYRFDVVTNYARKWSSRISQVEQFGQKIGPHALDAFEQAITKAQDAQTQDYLQALSDRVYSRRPTDAYHEGMAMANLAATGLQLGNPGTATLNLIGGTQLNTQMFGSRRMAQAYLELATEGRQVFKDGVEMGILGKDVLNILRDADNRNSEYMDANNRVKEQLSRFAAFTMKWGGYTGTEQVIRATGMIAARIQLMDALKAWNQSPYSKDARTYRAFMERNGFDVAKLIREGGKGEETARYLRRMVNIPQGSYRVDMTPLYVDTPIGRFMFKYQKFGTQVSRMFWQQKLKPFMDAVSDPSATSMDRARAFLPIMQWFGWAVLGGGAVLAARGAMFGYLDPGPELEEIAKAFEDDDTASAWGMVASKAHANLIAGSAYGFFGNYIQMGLDVADQQRVKNPFEPPGLAPVDAMVELVRRGLEQGRFPYAADFEQIAERNLSIYRTGKRGLAAIGRQAGVESDFVALEQVRRDLQYVRKAARRFADETGIDATRTATGRFGLTENTAANRKIVDALLIGNGAQAREIIREELRNADPEERQARLQSIRSTVRARQPVQLGGPASEAEVLAFRRWAKEKLPPSRAELVERMIVDYERAKRQAGL